MHIDRIIRFREETTRHVPTARQLLTLDDGIEPAMRCRLQDAPPVSLRIALTVPLEASSPEAARRRVIGQLAEGLALHVGKCRAFADGRILEVTVVQPDFEKPLRQALRGLGAVTRKAHVSSAAALTVLQFKPSRAGGASGDRAVSYGLPDGPQDAAGGAGPSPPPRGGSGSGASRPGEEEEDEHAARASLFQAIAAWDRRLRRSPGFQQAARQAGQTR